MCEFCMKHGEGKKWYLEAKNYSEDLLSDLRRRKFIQEFFSDLDWIKKSAGRLDKLQGAPWPIKRFLRWRIKNFSKKKHHGQIIPIEDVERIFLLTNSIVRVSCLCRYITQGWEKRYCYGISMGPNGGKLWEILGSLDSSFLRGPDSKGAEMLSREEALASFKAHEQEGLCHSIWTFVTPFLGGICNCDRPDCLAMKTTVTYDLPTMYRSEYIAEIKVDLCNGCRNCMRVCQFGALSYSAGNQKAVIDPLRCYGCGICRAVCSREAIYLRDRSRAPVAAGVW